MSVFLFGAGATLGWGSPLTSELTDLIRKSGFYCKDNKTRITEYIYQQLCKNGFSEWDVNFETIINVIEELMVYFSSFDTERKYPSLLQPFFIPNFEDTIFNFSIEGGELKHGYKLQIPANTKYDFAKNSYYHEDPKQFFLQHLISDLLTNINARISRYAYHTKSHSKVIGNNPDESAMFVDWMTKLSNSGPLRIYTLNYDRIFKILLERAEIKVFEGFEAGEHVDYAANIRADILKILLDSKSNIHYNLHGSVFWRVLNLDSNNLPNAEIVLTAGPQLAVNDAQAIIQVERGKTLMLSNIITGYQKAQKSTVTPFKQMQSVFDKDCSFANIFYIIGYSFGDEHINASLKTAMRYNEKLQIIIIDPYFIKNEMDSKLLFSLFSYGDLGRLKPNKIEENNYSYFEGKVTVYTLKFFDFLKQITGSTRSDF